MAHTTFQDQTDGSLEALRGNAICVAAIVLFSLGFPAAEILLETWGPISLIGARTLVACGLLIPIWLFWDGWRRIIRAPWLRGLSIGALGFGTGTVMLLVTQDLTDPVTAALVAAMMPVSAVALEVVFDGRRLSRNFLMGTALVLLGGVIASGASIGEGGFGLGALIGVAATLLFGWGSRQTVKSLPQMTSIGQTTLTLIGAMLFCQLVWVLFLAMGWGGTERGVLDAQGWALLLVFACVAMAISQAFWIMGVAKMGVGVASFHLNATPFYVMLILLAMGGAWNWERAIGAGILGCGVVLAQKRRRGASGVFPN